jgi:hypothetical protein
MLSISLASIAFGLVSIAVVILHDVIVERRVRRDMRAIYGAAGYSRAWRGENGRAYRYCLRTGRIEEAN